ncbi:uncharacterized protein BCR38DRAFT_407202 [Pseudomassariella vexata]|uniref:NACHT domain-containing protein n=1 Tax=Pseudomassariella vexata TaxID=1141098 RepID=A0A1Y2E6K9_9PEZI|nr:uncharacterized protein BCR38DRAFT_407202 [Pseudomassariella vexata]ORY67200.1 hypothetical protein BCR38DRAFT_407202 [Pseudomassariella vexata]
MVKEMRWFARLLKETNPPFRIVLLIYGLDEYIGDFDELLEVLSPEADFPFVKLILSSRPVIRCTEEYSRYPSLRLQDLTYNDIRQYAEDIMRSRFKTIAHPLGSSLDLLSNELAKQLQECFVGVKNGDREDELPSDLATLYGQMVEKIPSHYRIQAANLFKIMIQSVEHETCEKQHYSIDTLIQVWSLKCHPTLEVIGSYNTRGLIFLLLVKTALAVALDRSSRPPPPEYLD